MYTFKSNIIPEVDSLKYLYTETRISEYDNIASLHTAIQDSDYCFTAWDEDLLIGTIRSSGDSKYMQFITDFTVHEEYNTKGVASKLINTYLEATKDIKEYFLISKNTLKGTYMINWLEHKGFFLTSKTNDIQIFHRRNS